MVGSRLGLVSWVENFSTSTRLFYTLCSSNILSGLYYTNKSPKIPEQKLLNMMTKSTKNISTSTVCVIYTRSKQVSEFVSHTAHEVVGSVDPSAAAASRRAEFLGMAAPPPNFFMAQPNPSRIFQTFQPAEYFSAQIRREHTA